MLFLCLVLARVWSGGVYVLTMTSVLKTPGCWRGTWNVGMRSLGPSARGSDSTGLVTQHRGLGFALVFQVAVMQTHFLPHCRCDPVSYTLWMGRCSSYTGAGHLGPSTVAGRCDQDLNLSIMKSGWFSPPTGRIQPPCT